MRRRDIRRSNQNFMMGIVSLALLVLIVVAFFWYWCLP